MQTTTHTSPDSTLMKLGGAAGLTAALTYLFGLVLLVAVLLPAGFKPGGGDAETTLAAMADNAGLYQLWIAVIYKLNAGALVLLSAALAITVSAGNAGARLVIFGFGVLWAGLVLAAGMVASVGGEQALALYQEDPIAAALFWRTVHTIELGLGGGNEIAGTFWAAAVTAVGLRLGTISRLMVVLGGIIAVAGVLTLVEWAGEAPGAVFGIAYVVWFTAAGLQLMFDRRSKPNPSQMPLLKLS